VLNAPLGKAEAFSKFDNIYQAFSLQCFLLISHFLDSEPRIFIDIFNILCHSGSRSFLIATTETHCGRQCVKIKITWALRLQKSEFIFLYFPNMQNGDNNTCLVELF
jgi:hypothetical protein